MIAWSPNCKERLILLQQVKFTTHALPTACLVNVFVFFSFYGSVWALSMLDSLGICFNVGLRIGLFNINQLQMY